MTPVLILLALGGCRSADDPATGADFFDGDWACEHQPWDWYADAVQALLEADDDGEFDYDPPDGLVTRRAGSYDYDSGDFSWSNEFDPDYYGVSGEVEGYGVVYGDGDVDLLYRSVFTDVLGEIAHARVRMERTGCTASFRSWDIDADDDIAQVPSEDPFGWDIEIISDDRVDSHTEWEDGGDDWVADRVQTSDLVTVSDYGTTDGSITINTTSQGDGTSSSSQTLLSDDFHSYYQIDTAVDGSRDVVLEGYEQPSDTLYQECTYTIDYAGDGGGTCTFYTDQGDIGCDLTFGSDGSCLLDCGTYGQQDCS